MGKILREEMVYQHPDLNKIGVLTIKDITMTPFAPEPRHSPATLLRLLMWQFEQNVRFGWNLCATVRDEKTGKVWTFEPIWFEHEELLPPKLVWPTWRQSALVSLEETEAQKLQELLLKWMPFEEYGRRFYQPNWSRP